MLVASRSERNFAEDSISGNPFAPAVNLTPLFVTSVMIHHPSGSHIFLPPFVALAILAIIR